MNEDQLSWVATRVIYFLAGAYLVASSYAPKLTNDLLTLIMLFGGILIGIEVTKKKKKA